MKLKHVLICSLFFTITRVIYAQDSKKLEPTFEEIYFTDKDNNRVEEVTFSDKYIYIVVVSTNAKGEKATIKLEEEDGDYIYKNKFVTAHNKIGFKIKKDIHKEKFVIYNPEIKKHQRLKKRAEKK